MFNKKLEYLLVERKEDEWFYILENDNVLKNIWDWLGNCTAFGPVSSKESAEKSFNQRFTNSEMPSIISSNFYNALPANTRQKFEDLFSRAEKI